MLLSLYFYLARLFRRLSKTVDIRSLGMQATFVVPINNNYIRE